MAAVSRGVNQAAGAQRTPRPPGLSQEPLGTLPAEPGPTLRTLMGVNV